jgi:hypothetical protein
MKTERQTADGGSRFSANRQGRRALALALWIPVAALAGAPVDDPATTQGATTAASPAQPSTATTLSTASPLDRRMALLTAELALTASQQSQVKALLRHQREDVRQLWSDPAMPAAWRVGRTQAISERTADAIRNVLDEEQRKKYIQPRQRNASVGAGGAGVEAWMTPARQ